MFSTWDAGSLSTSTFPAKLLKKLGKMLKTPPSGELKTAVTGPLVRAIGMVVPTKIESKSITVADTTEVKRPHIVAATSNLFMIMLLVEMILNGELAKR